MIRNWPRVAMSLLLIAGVFVVRETSVEAQNFARTDSPPFVVSVSEATIDNRNLVTATDCILVLPDGRFHLERRKEVAPNPTSSLSIFESSLDSMRLQQLHDILNDENVKRLPNYALPAFPMAVPWFSTFDAKIEQAGRIRKVGYWLWQGGTDETSPNSTPDSIKKVWKDSQVALQPLLEWFHGVETLKLSPSGAKSTQCRNADEDSDTNPRPQL
jgi:hypothetical protein